MQGKIPKEERLTEDEIARRNSDQEVLQAARIRRK